MKIAVLYQINRPPVIKGIKKPMKEGGYSDSGADICYCLHKNNIDVVTPVKHPDMFKDFDWVFPDTEEGILHAISLGADTIWLNTVLYENHPIENFNGISIIGQRPSDVSKYDDKYYTNNYLRNQGFPVVKGVLLNKVSKYNGDFPCVVKPVRGRGSQGVIKCCSADELYSALKKLIDSGIYGDEMIVEPFLDGKEITVSVLPNGICLPVVERFNHCNGIAPYNGVIAVSKNSRAVLQNDESLNKISDACSKAVISMDLKALVRIDCRENSQGEYEMFDFNLKPNMTGAVRPHRLDQDSLTMIAASAVGWSYYDLLNEIIQTKWQL